MIGLIFFIIWLFAGLFSLAVNRDIFSPAKFYFLNLLLFFADIFFSPYSVSIYLVYISLIIVGLIVALMETFFLTKKGYHPGHNISYFASHGRLNGIVFSLWFASLVPILAQLYLIHSFGGIEGYVNILRLRVLFFRGLGPIIVLTKTMAVINIVYFGVMLIANRKGSIWWVSYILHLTILIIIGLLSASRGALLTNFVIMAIMYHYLKRPISLKMAAVLATPLLVIALVVGMARNAYRVTEEGFQTGVIDDPIRMVQSPEIKAGLIPLEFVFSQEPKNLQYGLTFLSAVTNFIPRTWWPGKPDTGGVVLTKDYIDEETSQTTNLSGGIIAESVINFGQYVGMLFGITSLLGILCIVVSIYSKVISKLKEAISPKLLVQLVFYMLFMNAATGLSVSEFTATFTSTAIQIATVWLIYIITFRINIIRRSA